MKIMNILSATKFYLNNKFITNFLITKISLNNPK